MSIKLSEGVKFFYLHCVVMVMRISTLPNDERVDMYSRGAFVDVVGP